MTATKRKPRRAPLIRCRCGRMHRSWNPHKVCNACVRETLKAKHDDLAARAVELITPKVDAVHLRRVHDAWLAKQPADHPWRRSCGADAGASGKPANAPPGRGAVAPAQPTHRTLVADVPASNHEQLALGVL